jgi:hypothetical protein
MRQMKIGEKRQKNIPLFEMEERFEYIDWDAKLKEHNENMEREERERVEKIGKAEKMKKSWELPRICMGYIRENSERWKKEEKERLEKKKKEEEKHARKDLVAKKRAKGRENLLQKKITENLQNLPAADRENFQKTEDDRRKRDLRDARLSNWKDWRGMSRKKKEETLPQEDGGNSLEEKLSRIEEMLETVKKEEDERNMRLRKKEKLEERYGMVRWISTFIDENSEIWEADKIEKEYSREGE